MTGVVLNPDQPLAISSSITIAASARIGPIDMLRGVAMVLMQFDHSAGFSETNIVAESYGRVLPTLSSIPHVLIGLITNIASGIFFTLAGASMAFFENSRRKRGWSERQITRFFIIRATILVMIEVFLSKVAYTHHALNVDVLTATAFAMVVLALVRLLPLRLIAFGAVMLFFTYPLLVDWFPHNPAQPLSTVTTLLFQYHQDSAPYVEFPLMGRLSLVLAGYVLARLLLDKKVSLSARNLLLASSIALLLAGVLRLMGGYGNFTPYQPGMPVIYWFIESKHPPSLVFLLFNGGIALAVLTFLQAFNAQLQNNAIGRTLTTLGQTAMFFYVVHLLLFRVIIAPLMPANVLPYGGIMRELVGWGLNLMMMLPLCVAYRDLRRKYPEGKLQYF